jgi:sulfur carrier protein ThiS adenylyltransferase
VENERGSVNMKPYPESGPGPSRLDLLATLTAGHGPDFRHRMEEAVVAVAGLGGLGSNAAAALARTGLGTLIIADFDVVETGNLNRQFYFLDQVGLAKTEATAENLRRINPCLKVVRHRVRVNEGNIPELFAPAGVVLECFDRADQKTMLMGVVVRSLPSAYFIGASGLAGYGASNAIRTWKAGPRVFLVGDLASRPESEGGLTAARVGIAALHQANLAVGLIIDPEATAAGLPDILED